MLGYAVVGALIAGVYGVFHDQITYSISPEYFTRLKFLQFHYADFGFPARVPESPNGSLVSEPERALLEMLSEVGLRQSVEEARHIMEGARSLRPEVLRRLLQECVRVKVVRLCTHWAEELKLPWSSDARKAAAQSRAAGKGRGTTRMKDGATLILKPFRIKSSRYLNLRYSHP